mmetsp:Transcript_12067/g.24509  ORF Transcript_12067/g.24509 Transcript_12067/m.24509 type:complete len:82 (+) Transcript_12067:86-331(+)
MAARHQTEARLLAFVLSSLVPPPSAPHFGEVGVPPWLVRDGLSGLPGLRLRLRLRGELMSLVTLASFCFLKARNLSRSVRA